MFVAIVTSAVQPTTALMRRTRLTPADILNNSWSVGIRRFLLKHAITAGFEYRVEFRVERSGSNNFRTV
jgi:hypothetical protein